MKKMAYLLFCLGKRVLAGCIKRDWMLKIEADHDYLRI